MSPYDQMSLDLAADELLVDLFAGGGGASVGIEMATGRQVDIAINHDAAAVSMHKANHPETHHFVQDVYSVDPKAACHGRPVGLLWASPDCTDHSKAKGSAPIRTKARRALAWVILKWAGQVRPRVIILENVEEFQDWGPLIGTPGNYRRDPKRKGKTFRRWVRCLRDMGYEVDWKELRACHYGAPTIRKRLFVVARCDGEPIHWPEKTHGPKRANPYRSAASCIDWTEPMCSIFATPEEAREWAQTHDRGTPRRPLAEATMRRIARGVVKFVLDNPEPFIVGVGGRMGQSAERPVSGTYQTITTKNDAALVAPYFVPRYGEREGQAPRALDPTRPSPVIVPTGNGASLVAAFLARHWGGMVGKHLGEPMPTVTTTGSQDQIVTAHLLKQYGTATGSKASEPLHTITAGGGKHALVASFLQKYYGQGTGQSVLDPAHTIRTKDGFGLVTVTIDGESYVLVDIAMRMLTPAELYRMQGFPADYRFERGEPLTQAEQLGLLGLEGADGEPLTKTEQLRMVGNSVSPQVAAALVRANAPALVSSEPSRWVA